MSVHNRHMDIHKDQIVISLRRTGSAYRVLLVEDNELNQEIAVELLAVTGVQVVRYQNNRELPSCQLTYMRRKI